MIAIEFLLVGIFLQKSLFNRFSYVIFDGHLSFSIVIKIPGYVSEIIRHEAQCLTLFDCICSLNDLISFLLIGIRLDFFRVFESSVENIPPCACSAASVVSGETF